MTGTQEDSDIQDTEPENSEQETGGGKPDATGRQIASRGVPSSESIYLPRYDSPELRSFQDKNESITRSIWNVDELTNFIFSKKYQPKYFEVAIGFLTLLAEKTEVTGEEIAAFVRTNGISKATFYNRVLPRLKRVGMIKVERDTIVAIESKRKFRPMRISLSKTFGNYFMKIGDSWLAVVDDARSKKEKKDQMKL
jgi:translation initiation factor RLI1